MRAGLTIPRAELSGLMLATRLQLRIARNYKPGLSSSHTLGDSTCVIASLDKNSTQFSPFFHSRISECLRNREKVSQKTFNKEICHVSTDKNIADLATRKTARITDIEMNSQWQTGPDWIRTPRKMWPVTRDINKNCVPQAETKTPIRIVSPTVNMAKKTKIAQIKNTAWKTQKVTNKREQDCKG